MNKLAIALSAALSLGAAASANAADATVNFVGEITSTSCSVGIDGAATAGQVNLAEISAATASTGAASSRTTPFKLQVGTVGTPCSAGTMDVKFVSPSGAVPGKIGNTAPTDAAGNVALVLMHETTDLDLTSEPTISATRATPGIYEYSMNARYERIDASTNVTAGAFRGAVGVELALR